MLRRWKSLNVILNVIIIYDFIYNFIQITDGKFEWCEESHRVIKYCLPVFKIESLNLHLNRKIKQAKK